MKIAFFEITDFEKQKFIDAFGTDETVFFEDTIQNVEVEKFKDAETLCVFVHSELTKELLESLPNLKLICTRSTGTDHIDAEYCKEKNIAIKNDNVGKKPLTLSSNIHNFIKILKSFIKILFIRKPLEKI